MMNERTVSQRALLWVGSIGFFGRLPASGTVTVAVVGIPLFWFLQSCAPLTYGIVTLLLTAAAIVIHQIGDRILGEKDSRRLVWDEIVGFLIAVAFVPFTWQIAVIALPTTRPPCSALSRVLSAS